MNDLINLKSNYQKRLISKADYIKRMYQVHKFLLSYPEFIKNTDIKKIEITDNDITIASRSSGIKLSVPKKDTRSIPLEILNFDSYEKEEFEVMVTLIKENDTIFDIGANIGWYTINFCKLFKKTKVFAFEPIPETFSYLKKNIKINGIRNAKIFNFAFSDKEGISTFYYNPQLSGNASSKNLQMTNSVKKISSPIKTIDSFVHRNKIKVDFIKCDVEGAELLVLKGGVNTLNKDKPIIFAEMLRKWMTRFKHHPNDLIQLLTNSGYGCFTIKGKKLKEFNKMTEETAETNFIFLHKEKHAQEIRKLSF